MKRILLAGFCWVFMWSISPAHAAEPQPGDACSNAGETMHAGGPEEIDGQMMVCDGANWEAVLEWDDATGQSLFQVDNDAGSCTATKTGRMRYDDGGDTWEYCDGSTWGTWLAVAPACTDDYSGDCILEATRANDDPEFTADKIKCGKNILGVTGTLGDNNAGLVGHWKFNESGNTSTAVDSAEGNNGTLTNFPADPSADWVSGKLSNALDFDGTDDTVVISSASETDDLITLTFAAWVYPRSAGENATGRYISKGSGLNPPWRVSFIGGNDVEFYRTWTTNAGRWTTSSDLVTYNTWHHVAVTYDGSSTANDPNIYVDGALQSEGQPLTPDGSLTSDAGDTLYIGNYSSPARTFDGLIDDVRIYNRVLSAQEISDLYNGGAGCE